MRRVLGFFAVIDTLSFVAGVLYLILRGSLPATVAEAVNAMQIAALILLAILVLPASILAYLVIESQLQKPML